MKKSRLMRIYRNIPLLIAISIMFFGVLFPSDITAQSGKKLPETGLPQKKNKRPDPSKQPQNNDALETPDKVDIDPIDIIETTTSLVNIETTVFHKKTRQPVKGLKRENFTIYVDGIKQDISYFSSPQAPITVTVVMEYSKLGELFGFYGNYNPQSRRQQQGKFEVLRPVAMFLTNFIKPPNDYASIIAFDMRPTPITDFTNNPARIRQAINLLLNNYPAFWETNVFDALQLALEGGIADSVVLENSSQKKSAYNGMVNVQGHHKAILLVASGIDTFSRINYGEARKIGQNSGVPIYVIGTGELFAIRFGDNMDPGKNSNIAGIPIDRMTFAQAKNTLNTFAKETGGAYFPLLYQEDLPRILNSINDLLRNQYSLGYNPGEVHDGNQHKIVVKVDVNGDGQFDDKIFTVSHRKFYNSPKPENPKPAK